MTQFLVSKHTYFSWLFLFVLIFILFQACKESNTIALDESTRGDHLEWRTPTKFSPEQEKKFQQQIQLARKHCNSCHEYVPPDFLDRITWPRVLMVMKQHMDKSGYVIDHDEWIAVQQFYLQYAPKAFHSTIKKHLPTLQNQFESVAIPNTPNTPNNATLLKYLEMDSTLYMGKKSGQLSSINSHTLQDVHLLPNIPIDLTYEDAKLLVLGIGSLAPSEARTGQLLAISPKGHMDTLVDSLIRPVHFQVADIPKISGKGYLIASFGSTIGINPSGKLSYFKNKSIEEQIIGNLSGAMQVGIADMDGDGKQEIIGLFTQANEAINVYTIDEKGNFILKSSLRFSPVYGTNSFQLADMNKDGFLDLLVTNGDNDDYSPIFKPYHGIRIYLNDQQDHFTPSYFYQINGASKVKAADIDQDGDIDFVVLAMYPDLFSRPYETLLYFKNIGQLHFKTHYFEAQPSANWMLLELADIDQDGDLDIITAANREIGGLLPPALKQLWIEEEIAAKLYYNKI